MTAPTFATGLSTPIYGGSTGLSNKHEPECFQKFTYTLANFTGTTTQSVALITIPAYTSITYLQVWVQTALTLSGTPSISVGDSSSTTAFVNAAATFTVNTVFTQAVTTCPLKTYGATADKLNLTITGGTTFPGVGVLAFTIGLVDMSFNAPMTVQ